MFHHAYDGYIRHAYPYDELRPLTCDGHDTWGSYSLTLIDALDMLVIMGNHSEFQRVADLVLKKMDFDVDINVSVFETNIRVVGGLLSAHLMSRRAGIDVDSGWPCSGPLLSLAENVARRLLPAFDTPTGMPYGTVNLKHGVPKGETTITCTAGVGTFIIEFGALSKLTGDPIFEKVAMRAMRSLWDLKSEIGLVGNHIDVATGKWTAVDSGVGGGVDSYFEYLVKGSIMLENPELLRMFNAYLGPIEQYLKRDDWYMWAHMTKGTISLPLFTSLDCYWPGIQVMLGDVDKAVKTIHNFHQVWKQFGFLPEYYSIVKNEAHAGREGYPLRPELVESAMYIYQATKDPYMLQIGVDMIESIEHNTRTKCGYATVKDVNTHILENRMESFFLAETAKYLYLLFDPDNFIHNTGSRGTVINTPNGQCVIDTGGYVFNTEAHPIDMSALYCCSAEKKADDIELEEFHDNLDLLALFDISDRKDTVQGVRWTKPRKQNEFTQGIMGSVDSKMESVFKGDNPNIISVKDNKVPEINIVTINVNDNGESVTEKDNKLHKEYNKEQTHDSHTIQSDKIDSKGSEESNIKSKYVTSDREDDKVTVTIYGENKITVGDGREENIDEENYETDNDENGDTNENNDKQKSSIVSSILQNIKVAQTTPRVQSQGGKLNDIMLLLQSVAPDIFSKIATVNLKGLHEKLTYYSLFQTPTPELMTCKAQPFHMRFSAMGELFVED